MTHVTSLYVALIGLMPNMKRGGHGSVFSPN